MGATVDDGSIRKTLRDKLARIGIPVGDPAPVDVAFAAMLHHHDDHGLALAELAAMRATDDAVGTKAAMMVAALADDLQQIGELLRTFRARPAPSPSQVEAIHHRQMRRLQEATGEAFDVAFLYAVSLHHVDGVHQAELFLKAGQDQRVRQLAEHTRDEQLQDLDVLRALLDALGG